MQTTIQEKKTSDLLELITPSGGTVVRAIVAAIVVYAMYLAGY